MANPKKLDRGIFQRIFGVPATGKPSDPGCFSYSGNVVTIDLNRAPELAKPGGALRCEGGGLPLRVLVVREASGEFKAYHNRCTHVGHRRLDPVPGEGTVQCCSVMSTTFSADGKSIHGPGKHPLTLFPVTRKGDFLNVTITNS